MYKATDIIWQNSYNIKIKYLNMQLHESRVSIANALKILRSCTKCSIGLAQERCSSIANALELCRFCTVPSICSYSKLNDEIIITDIRRDTSYPCHSPHIPVRAPLTGRSHGTWRWCWSASILEESGSSMEGGPASSILSCSLACWNERVWVILPWMVEFISI